MPARERVDKTKKDSKKKAPSQGVSKPAKHTWEGVMKGRGAERKLVLKFKGRWHGIGPKIEQMDVPSGVNITVGDHLKTGIDNKQVLKVIKAAAVKFKAQSKRARLAAKKQEERAVKRRFESGDESVGHSARQQAIRARKFEQRKNELIDAADDVHYMGGDSDDEFENVGLHTHIQDRIDKKHNDQLILMDDDADSLTWSKLPDDVRRAVEGMKRAAESDPEQVHHSTEPRPTYTAAQLVSQTPLNRPGLVSVGAHTGISGRHDDLSHSIPWAQAPSGARALNFEEGGVNHPKNIPYENFVTNQVVNKAIENVAQTYLDQGKKVVKVVVRYWNIEHIEKSMHIYFVEGLAQPLVFGTRDLGDKKPARFSHR